jgi:hypothetical protein
MCNFTYPYLKAISSHAAGRKNAGVSATMLNGCLRKAKWQQTRPYAQYPRELMAATGGTAWHDHLERYNEPEAICEVRLRYTLPSGRAITGKMDRYRPDLGRLEDYKRKGDGKIFTSPPEEYTLQLNVYRLFLTRGAICVDEDHPTLGVGERVQGPVDSMWLYPSAHKEEGRPVCVPKLDLSSLEEYLEAALDALAEPVPPRTHSDPKNDYFCRNFCPFLSDCTRAGGETVDLSRLLRLEEKDEA